MDTTIDTTAAHEEQSRVENNGTEQEMIRRQKAGLPSTRLAGIPWGR